MQQSIPLVGLSSAKSTTTSLSDQPSSKPASSADIAAVSPHVDCQSQFSQSQRPRRGGQCKVCLRQLSLTTTGVIHQHGRPCCPGTGQHPVEGSVIEVDHAARPVAANNDAVASDSSRPMRHDDFANALKSSRCLVLKRIPKASRYLAANTLSNVLSRVVNTSDSLEAWYDVLLFGHVCFGVPGQRGGKRHLSSLASKVNKALEAFPTNTRQPDSKTGAQVRKQNSKYNLAARVSEKLEDGDVRGAIRLQLVTIRLHHTATRRSPFFVSNTCRAPHHSTFHCRHRLMNHLAWLFKSLLF